MPKKEPKSHSPITSISTALAAVALVPACWHISPSKRVTDSQVAQINTHIHAAAAHRNTSFRTGFADHLTDIANLTNQHNREADLRAWKTRVAFLAAQPGITDIRVAIAASDLTTHSKGRLLWIKPNLNVYGAAFDYARTKHLNIILIAMPPRRDAGMNDSRYRSMTFSYYYEIGRFAKTHSIADINLNEFGVHNAATEQRVTSLTPKYLDGVVSLFVIASHAIRRYVPRARIIVSESAAMTEEATKRLLAVFAALKKAGVPFVRGLNIYAGGPVEIAQIAPLVDEVKRGGEVWITEFGVASVGVENEASQARKIGEIFGAIIKGPVKRVIGYEEMDEPRLQNLTNISSAEKNYGIVWRANGSIKPAAKVFLSIARNGNGKRSAEYASAAPVATSRPTCSGRAHPPT